MNRFILLATMFAVVLGVSAQRRMQVWEGNTYMQFFTADVDSVTFLSFPEGILQECEEIHDTIIKTVTVHDTITQIIRDTVTTTIKDTVYIHDCPDAGFDKPLSGVFSVSDTKRVRFSRGNLQYTQSTQTWSFAEHQYDMIGTDNVVGDSVYYNVAGSNKCGSAFADKIDLFGWSSTGSAKWGISTLDSSHVFYGDFMDWGKNIGDGNTWYTLTNDEWSYLCDKRPNADRLAGVARINLNADGTEYANGLILLPDSWACPADVTFKSGFVARDKYDDCAQAYANYQTLTIVEWQKIEAAGAVFLPASGENNIYYLAILNVQCRGIYWSATPMTEYSVYCLYIHEDGMKPNGYNDGNIGQAVRLVQDVK